MKNSKLIGSMLWLIGLAAECGLPLFLAKSYSTALWVTFGFTLFVFISQLALWSYIWRDPLSGKDSFFHMPLFVLSILYMLLQAVPCIVFALWQAPAKIAVLVNVVLTAVMWILLLTAMLAKNHIASMDSKQKDHHKAL